jgi:beta-1,2-mannosidase
VVIATSKDLIHWVKYGPAFPRRQAPAYRKYKSAGILTKVDSGRLIAAKVHGQYWMYWGEENVHLATSRDLIHWTPIEDKQGNPIVLFKERTGLFDSGFPEAGPPPVLTKKGIVLIYNGKNAAHDGAPKLDAGAYSGGQALFLAEKSSKVTG